MGGQEIGVCRADAKRVIGKFSRPELGRAGDLPWKRDFSSNSCNSSHALPAIAILWQRFRVEDHLISKPPDAALPNDCSSQNSRSVPRPSGIAIRLQKSRVNRDKQAHSLITITSLDFVRHSGRFRYVCCPRGLSVVIAMTVNLVPFFVLTFPR
jgi:hypothetical protein